MIHVLDIFSGIGGFSLGLESTGHFRTVGFCEIEPFCREVLRKHWPGVPIWEDVRELTADSLGMRPDAIVGGFPCQDISVAGKGEGIEGARSGLWSEFARLVEAYRPRWVLAENVGALRTRGIDRVCSDLEGEGYSVWPLVVGAWAVGAPHRRDRVWIVARQRLADSDSTLRDREQREPGGREDRVSAEGQAVTRGDRSDVAHGSSGGQGSRWPARPGEEQHEWEEPRLAHGASGKRCPSRWVGESCSTSGNGTGEGSGQSGESELPLGGSTDGLPLRLARRWNREALKALGNSVVPQVVAVIGQAIAEVDSES